MMNENKIPHVAKEKFAFVNMDERIHDKKFETKPVSYMKDVLMRFSRNKASVVAACIILILLLYALFIPVFFENNYTRALTDTTYLNYGKLPPKSKALSWLGMSGENRLTLNQSEYLALVAIGKETGLNPIVKVYREAYEDSTSGSSNTKYYDVLVDEYYRRGNIFLTLTGAQYQDLQKWQLENDIQVIFPALKDGKQQNANVWYAADPKGSAKLDKEGNFIAAYRSTKATDTSYQSKRVPFDNDPQKPLSYARVTGTSSARSYVVRANLYNYFIYRYGFEPAFAFGSNARGQDILTRLAYGARFSFMLAICISVVNMFIGAMYGAVQGYYGGRLDLYMGRLVDVLGGIPFIVLTTLFQLHFAKHVGPVVALIFAFIFTGWIGMAYRVRMQFYRFKRQEYILAARTLGAGDRRLMFKHIFPNSMGTIITGSVLTIPGVIFGESSLTYLGIINLESSTMTSVGTMLANGRDYLQSDPYIIFFPALFISLLMVSFNLFGNGLRDAFNPSLRGVE